MITTEGGWGRVVSISGSRVRGSLSAPAGQGEGGQAGPQIGGLVKMPTLDSVVFGMIGRLETVEGREGAGERRYLEVDLVGEAMADQGDGGWRFKRGVSVFPSLGAPIYPASRRDLAMIHAPADRDHLVIGSLKNDPSIKACLSTDDLVGKHFAVLGNTGTGKSCGVTAILRALLASHPAGHVVLLDPHDEYAEVFGERARVISPRNLSLPYWLLSFEEICEVLCSRDEGSRQAEAAILKEAVLAAKRASAPEGIALVSLTVDTPTPYRLDQVLAHIKKSSGRLNRPENAAPYLRIMSRLDSLRRDVRYGFMFGGKLAQDSMVEIIAEILRIPTGGRPISIITLAGLPGEVVDVVVSSLCRLIFDFALHSPVEAVVPVLLICEEAHRYAPRDPELGFGPTRRALARIAKEGRKYGVSLGLVTQRPSEISELILSQCNTLFALRLNNDRDQRFMAHALPEGSAAMLAALPALGTQEALVAGEAVSLPMLIRFAALSGEQRPHSALYRVSQAWQRDAGNGGFVSGVVSAWRNQSRPGED